MTEHVTVTKTYRFSAGHRLYLKGLTDEENFAVFDFALTAAEMAEIGGLARRDGRIIDYAFSGSPNWD